MLPQPIRAARTFCDILVFSCVKEKDKDIEDEAVTLVLSGLGVNFLAGELQTGVKLRLKMIIFAQVG
jgi:hypothetical protein